MKMIAKITVNEEKLSIYIYTLKIILTIAVSLNIF